MSKYFVFCVLVIQYFLVTNSKQFGYLDLFTCHCKDDRYCNSDGTCKYNGCTTGWYGSTCQQQNVALRKPANQGSRQQSHIKGPELVVDGDRSQYNLRCMDTGYSNNRWWSVNLTDTYPIRQILIIYRTEYINGYLNDTLYLYTLKGFKVDVIQDNGDSVVCYKQPDDTQPPSSHITVTCNNTIWGSGINISSTLIRIHWILLLCEVEIYVCSNRTYGEGCEKFCYCKDNVPCDYITGKCPTKECLPGYTGSSCNEKCDNTMYGINCSRSCDDRNCYGSNECNHVSGNCTEGCLAGFSGVDCTEKCPNGFYGPDCLKICANRNCLQNPNCDSTNGTCPDGCEPGFISTDCTQECDDGSYGVNCSKKCSEINCVNNSTDCSIVDGSCNGKCIDGYTDKDCSISSRHATTEGQVETSGGDDDDETSIIIGVLVGIIILMFIIIVGVCVYFRKRTPSTSSSIKDPPVVYDVITTSNNLNTSTPTAGHIYINDVVEDDLPKQANDNHYNTLGAAYENENLYEQITK